MLERTLARLVEDGGSHNRAVVYAGSAWFVLHAARGVPEVEVEAAASAYLPEKLSLDRVAALRKAGFAGRPGRKTLRVRWPVEALGERLEAVAAEAFGGPLGDVELHLGEREPTRNPVLIEAMRVLAKKRDTPSRHQLYRRLLAAEVLLLVEGEEPAVVGDLQGWEVAACFTDWDALGLFDPRGRPYTLMRGRALAPLLYARPRLGSLLINPRGTVGGELYRNELEALARASRR